MKIQKFFISLIFLSYFIDNSFAFGNFNDPFAKPTPTPTPSYNTIGNPYYKPTPKPIYTDPFAKPTSKPTNPFYKPPSSSIPYKPKPIEEDPFNKPNDNIHNDPFNNKPSNNSGAYNEIKKLDGLNSYTVTPILRKIALRKNLSASEQVLIINFSEKLHLEGKVDVLKALLSNSNLSEQAKLALLKLIKNDYTLYSKNKDDLLTSFCMQHSLSISMQTQLIDIIFDNLITEESKEEILIYLINNKYLKKMAKSEIITNVSQKFSFEDKKFNVLYALVTEKKLSENEQKTFVTQIENYFYFNDNKKKLFYALLDYQDTSFEIKDYLSSIGINYNR
ncbi:MAG: hypothetical protein U0457_05530 [Candidatus Sericytochromatia bacterium]